VHPVFQNVVSECYQSSMIINEDSKNYFYGWQPYDEETVLRAEILNDFPVEFAYWSADYLKTTPSWGLVSVNLCLKHFQTPFPLLWHDFQMDLYSGGGYVLELEGSVATLQEKLLKLQQNHWIDRKTRAVMVEFQAYNAFANLFVYVKITVEFPITSGKFHQKFCIFYS